MTTGIVQNQSETITTEHSTLTPSSAFDFSVVISISLFLLVLINLVFTLCFYISWKKKQNVRRRQSTVEMQTYNIDEMPSRQSAEHIYAGVRDSVATFQSGAYATLDSSYARVDCLDNSVLSRDNCSRSKNKMKTLTTLFTLNSQDVKNILSKLDPDYK